MDKSDSKNNSGKQAEGTNSQAHNETKSVSSSSTKSVVRLKYEMCKNFRETGSCKYGDRCLFAHGAHELINRGGTAAEPEKPEKTEESAKVEEDKEKVPATSTE